MDRRHRAEGGLFRAIADAGDDRVTEEALAQELGYEPRHVGVWCREAYAFELLDWDERSGYRLAPHMHELLLTLPTRRSWGAASKFYAALYEDYLAFPE